MRLRLCGAGGFMSAFHRYSVLLLLALSLLTSACSNRKELNRAIKLQQDGNFTAALDSYRAQLANTSAKDSQRLSELEYRIGECLFQLERPSEAFSAYNKAIEFNDSNTMAHLRLGELYLLAGAGDKAAEHARSALHNGASIDALSLLGAAAAANGNTEAATDAFTRVLTAEPRRVKVAISLAEIYSHNGKMDEARTVLRNSAAAQPTSAAPLLALGRLEEQQGDLKQAEKAYRDAVSAEDSPQSNQRMAQFLERSGRVAEAEDALRKVDALQRQYPVALSDFQMITGRSPTANATYLSALRSAAAPPRSDKSADATERREHRAQMIARVIESDLECQRVPNSSEASSTARISSSNSARQHLAEFRNELDAATVHMLEAEIAVADNDLPRAYVEAAAAVSLAPESAASHYVLGVVKYRSGDPSGARAEWESALDEQSRFVPARVALASYLLRTGDFGAAQDFIVPAVREEPGNFEALLLFSRVLIARRSYDAAEIIAKRAGIVAPDSAEPHMLIGQSALEQERPGQALLEFQQAVLLEPRSRAAIEGLTNVYRSGTITRAMLVKMEGVAAADKPSPTLMEITGRLFADHGLVQDARRCLREALELDPTRTSAAAALATVEARSGDYSAARDSAARIGNVQQLLTALRAQDDRDLSTAIINYEAAVRAGENSGVAANNLAWIYAEQGSNLERALELATRARELAPTNAGVVDTLGFVHLKRREYTQAISALERARDMVMSDGDSETLVVIKRHLSEAYLRAGQPDQAALVASLRIADPAVRNRR
jgi:tetratricopeptide (TPR) repeat protein